MASEWRASSWGNEISLEYGKSLRGYDEHVGRYRVFGSNGPIGWTSESLADGPGVILGRKGACRGVEYSREPFFVIDTAYYVVAKTQLDMRWLYYAILHHKLGEIDDGSPIPSTTRAAVYVLDLDVPPRTEQSAIAHILGTLDDKIELNRKMNETLEEIARAIFKSWFVDFDPVRAKAGGRDPGLPKHISDLFPDSLEDSELGEMPKGWKLGNVSDLADLSRESVTPASVPTQIFEHYSIPAFDEGRVAKRELGESIKSNKFVVPAECVLISKLNPRIRRIWMPDTEGSDNAVCSTEFLVAVPKSPATRDYLFCLFSSDTFCNDFTMMVIGTSGSHQRVRSESLLTMKARIPPAPLLSQFSAFVEPMLKRIAANIKESMTLAALRDTLLPKLISGEIRVRDAERFVGNTVS